MNLADLLLLLYNYSMFSKERAIAFVLTAAITLPLSASILNKPQYMGNSLTHSIKDNNEKTASIQRVFFSRKKTDDLSQEKIQELREQALADIEARKEGKNAKREQEELEAQNHEAENENTASENVAIDNTTNENLENERLEQERLEKERLAKQKAEEARKAAEAEKAAALAASEEQKKEKERLQAQIEKELENQKNQKEKNKKEYLSDYMLYDIESINDSDDIENTYSLIPDPDERDASGRTLLMRAAKSGNEWELKELLASKANVNLTDSDGWTALMYAVRYSGSYECVEKLLEAGAEVSAKNNYGFSALVLAACYNGNPQILTKLLDSYKASDKEVLKALVFLLSEQNISERQELSKLQIFMDKAVPLNILYEGKTPLMYAAQYGNSTKIIQTLLLNQASVTLRSTEGKTAFDYAVNNKNLVHDEIYWALNKK